MELTHPARGHLEAGGRLGVVTLGLGKPGEELVHPLVDLLGHAVGLE